MSLIWDQWLAGKTLRSHTKPVLRNDNVAEHTFGVLLIALYYFRPTLTTVRAIMHHDLAESFCGDIPHPAKQRFPELYRESKLAEQIISREMDLEESQPVGDEAVIYRLCDLVEYVYYRADEWMRGNRYGVQDIGNALDLIDEQVSKLEEVGNINQSLQLLNDLSNILWEVGYVSGK